MLMNRTKRTDDTVVVADMASATRKLMSVGFILGLTASMPLRILTQGVNVPVRGRFPLPTLPGISDPEMGWVEYLSRAESRMSKAWALFAEGLEDEAGEEAWRAVIDAVHAVTTLAWGKVVRSHTGLKRVVSLLEREGIVKIASEFGNVESLHTNYYEPGYDRYMIRKYLEYAERIITKAREAVYRMVASAALIARIEEVSARVVEAMINTLLRIYPDLTVPRRSRKSGT